MSKQTRFCLEIAKTAPQLKDAIVISVLFYDLCLCFIISLYLQHVLTEKGNIMNCSFIPTTLSEWLTFSMTCNTMSYVRLSLNFYYSNFLILKTVCFGSFAHQIDLN